MSFPSAENFAGTDRFTLKRKLGAGANGVVYLAYDQERSHHVALKTLSKVGPSALYRFKNEFRQLVDLQHPQLVSLFNIFSERDYWFFTMEFIEGTDYLSFVRSHEKIDFEASLETNTLTWERNSDAWKLRYEKIRDSFSQLIKGLAYLHDREILHRDVKPSNVIVDGNGSVKLLDFGLIKEMASSRVTEDSADEDIQNYIVGTAAYMSPEQGAGLPLTPASDLYSAGVILYEALTDHLPFSGRLMQIIQDKQRIDPPEPSEFLKDIPEDLNSLCANLLRRCPDDRPSNAEILAQFASHKMTTTETPTGVFWEMGRTLIGREFHLLELRNSFEELIESQKSMEIHISGNSGMGKTTLVDHFLNQLLDYQDDAVILRGRCYEQDSVPFKTVDSLIDDLSRYLISLSKDEIESILPNELSALVGMFPVLGRVEAIEKRIRGKFVIPDHQERRKLAVAALLEIFSRIAKRYPLILVIDDLQWGDVDGADILNEVLHCETHPMLMTLLSYRNEDVAESACIRTVLEDSRNGFNHRATREVRVEPLDRFETKELCVRLLGNDWENFGECAEKVATESSGNPYFVEVLVKYERANPGALCKGFGLEDAFRQSMLELTPQAIRLLGTLAVASQPLRQSAAFQAAELGQEEADVTLKLLESHRLLRRTGSASKSEIVTYHDRTRNTVLAHISEEELKEYHLRLATTLKVVNNTDPAIIAYHYRHAEFCEEACEFYTRAVELATKASAFDRAAELCRSAIELGQPEFIAENDLKRKLGDALADAGRGKAAAEAYLAAAVDASASKELKLNSLASSQYLFSGHFSEGFELLKKVLSSIGIPVPKTPKRALVKLIWNKIRLYIRGLKVEYRPRSLISEEDLARIDITWSAALALSGSDVILGAYFHSVNLLLALKAGEPSRLTRALAMESFHSGAVSGTANKRTQRLLEEAVTVEQRIENPHASGFIEFVKAMMQYFDGHWMKAQSHFQKAEAIYREQCTGLTWESDSILMYSTMILWWQGDLLEMQKRVPKLLEEARDRNDLYLFSTIRLLWAEISMVHDDVAEALERFQQGLSERDPDDPSRKSRSSYEFLNANVSGLLCSSHLEIYKGNGVGAWLHINEHWSFLERSLHLRVKITKIIMYHLRSRCALAAAMDTNNPETYLKLAEKDARRVAKEKDPWAVALATLLRGSIAFFKGQREESVALFKTAAEALEENDMALYAAVARRRQGEAMQSPEGDAILEKAEAWMRHQNIENPARMSHMLAPCFPLE